MAFNISFVLIENSDLQCKSAPWRCDNCHKSPKVLLKVTADYDMLVLCKKCLLDAKKLITNKEKELKDAGKSTEC